MKSQSTSTQYSSSQAIRIVNLDSYMSPPISGLDVTVSEFRGSSISQVPVLRLFGSIPTGEKICVHIHGVFPYIYIPYDGTQNANILKYKIAACIDKAVNISLNQGSSSMQHVYKITLVSGIPMYGYHPKEHQFFKIYLYNPLLVRKVTGLLTNETTLGNIYQPHEAHLNFTLQFMMDYNLHGMSNMNLSKIKYRLSKKNDDSSQNVNPDPDLFLPSSVTKLTVCQLEGDCLAEDIINRLEIASGNIGANPGIAALWNDEYQRRRNKGMDSQIEHLLELKRTDLPPTKSHLIYKDALANRLIIFSKEKNLLNKLNSSVYPAETPDSTYIQHAYMTDSQIPSSSESSSEISNNLEETIPSADNTSINISLDQDAQQLLKVLNELEENVNEVEDDSILTQLSKENEQDKYIEDNDLDFSMSLEAVTTPVKVITEKCDSEGSDDDLWDTTLIPQVDGGCDESIKFISTDSMLIEPSTKRKKPETLHSIKYVPKIFYIKTVKIGRDMPDLNDDFNFKTSISEMKTTNKSNQVRKAHKVKDKLNKEIKNRSRKYQKLTGLSEKDKEIIKTATEVRRFEYRVRKLKRQDQLVAMLKKLHRKENEITLFISKTGHPKFRVISKDKVTVPRVAADKNNTSKINILSDIIVKMAHYVDPTLYLIIKYPDHCCYLYDYRSKFFPEVTKIPRKICRSRNDTNTLNYIKNHLKKSKEVKLKIEDVELNEKTTLDTENDIETKYKEDLVEDKEKIFIFSDQYLNNVNNPALIKDIRKKSDDELVKMAEDIRQQLQKHIKILKSPKIYADYDFPNEHERLNTLNSIKCLQSNDEILERKLKENNNNNIGNENSSNFKIYGNDEVVNNNESLQMYYEKPDFLNEHEHFNVLNSIKCLQTKDEILERKLKGNRIKKSKVSYQFCNEKLHQNSCHDNINIIEIDDQVSDNLNENNKLDKSSRTSEDGEDNNIENSKVSNQSWNEEFHQNSCHDNMNIIEINDQVSDHLNKNIKSSRVIEDGEDNSIENFMVLNHFCHKELQQNFCHENINIKGIDDQVSDNLNENNKLGKSSRLSEDGEDNNIENSKDSNQSWNEELHQNSCHENINIKGIDDQVSDNLNENNKSDKSTRTSEDGEVIADVKIVKKRKRKICSATLKKENNYINTETQICNEELHQNSYHKYMTILEIHQVSDKQNEKNNSSKSSKGSEDGEITGDAKIVKRRKRKIYSGPLRRSKRLLQSVGETFSNESSSENEKEKQRAEKTSHGPEIGSKHKVLSVSLKKYPLALQSSTSGSLRRSPRLLQSSAETSNSNSLSKDEKQKPSKKRRPPKVAPKQDLSISVKTSPKVLKSSETGPVRRSKRLLLQSLDGAFDSEPSSEDEKQKRKLEKRCRTPKLANKYKALPISVQKSPKALKAPETAVNDVTTNAETCQKTPPSIVPLSQNPVCDTNVKRQLFQEDSEPILQSTVVEEKLICSYSNTNTNRITDININPSNQNFHDESSTDTSNSATIFSTDSDNHEKSFFVTEISEVPKLTAAEKYDKETNYKAKQGCSKYLTPLTLSQEKLHSSGSASSDLITPYQKLKEDRTNFKKDLVKVDNYPEDVTTVQSTSQEKLHSSESSSYGLITPYQKLKKDRTNLEKTVIKDESTLAQVDNYSKVVTNIQNISQEMLQSSGSSSSGLITPYQKLKEDGTNLEKTEVKVDNYPENITKVQSISQEKLHSSGSSNSDLITPYQHPKSEKIKEDSIKVDNYSRFVTIIPKFKPPTRKDVINSLDLFKIPHIKFQEPFYSNAEDVTGSMEVGFNVLKINSKTTAHLTEFESQTDSLNSFRKVNLETLPSNMKLNKTNINNIILSYCKNRDCIITPVKKPPDLKTVQNWIQLKSKRPNTPEIRIEKIKIHVPLSPGANSDDDDMDLSLTLSPLTPKNSQSSQNASDSTSTSSKLSEITSPIFRDKYKKRKKEIRDRILTRSVRKSLTLTEDRSETYSGQITGISINVSLDKSAQNLQNARAIIEHQNLTVMVMELHIRTRGDLKPDPAYDSIRAIFYSILHDVPKPNLKGSSCRGVIAINSIPLSPGVSKIPLLNGSGVNCEITYVDSEDNLINEFLKVIDYWDPDIFAGYEIELLSWGYLIERGYVLNMNLKPLLGRVRDKNVKQKEEESLNELRLTGRIVLDVWRLMRHEIALQSYTFESIAYHILHKRFPYYSFKDLSFWWDHKTQLYRHRTVNYYLIRVVTVLELFDKLDFLGRTSELARLFGIQFYEVLSRGSQFRVESMMLRLAKPLNFIAVSPSVQQRAHMKAPEYIALVMEPESKLYTDPVIVLDFQSLYPSIIIAYNYCFTTCIGRVENLGKNGPFQFGATQLKVSRSLLKKLLERNELNFSPCGAAFVKKKVRDGIMPRMLREILDTRLMVKNSMKENKEDKILQKVLHNRQLGLKLIANVTYGYTAANFSGRMPAVEIGDSVVSKGRETLQRAIELVDNTPEWGARVVYGDTDSLFVLVPGRTKEHAFTIGQKIADAVTNANPDPIKLKLEKVYQPCILQTKKRYVGYMYENAEQKEPVYEAKGIETVRRDGCPAVSKMLEKCLRIIFETKDVSLVKKYVLKQFNKIIAGRVSIQDLTFAKEYRGASGYRPGACVPALELTKRWTAVDKRNEPRNGERVPYVIVNGPPGLPLIRLVRSPRDLINDSSQKPNSQYYITRVIIPPINRCFNLLGADLNTWFNQMPRKKTQYLPGSVSPKKKSTISQYFLTSNCISCEEQTQLGICQNCQNKPQNTVVTLMEKLRLWERNYHRTLLICQTCTSSVLEVKCVSLDCPVYYRRMQTSRDEQQTTYVRQLLSSTDLLF